MSYALKDVLHETHDFWVLDVDRKGFEVYRKGPTCSTRVASIGRGEELGYGLPRAIQEAEARQRTLDAQHMPQ